MIRRLSIAAIFICLAASAPAYTNLWNDKFYLEGEARSVLILDDNVPDRAHQPGGVQTYQEVPTRLLLGAGYRPHTNINLFASAVFFTLWGRDGGQPQYTAKQAEHLNLAEGYLEVNNIFDMLHLKIGRQVYLSNEISFKPNVATVERLIYNALDGLVARVDVPTTEVTLIGGRKADFNHDNGNEVFTLGLQTKTDLNDNLGLYAYFYDNRPNGLPTYGSYGVKPYLNYNNFALAFRYLRMYNEGSRAFNEQPQLFDFDLRYIAAGESMIFVPRANISWTAGKPGIMTITFNKALIVEQILGNPVLYDSIVYNIGFDNVFKKLEDINFSADAFYYQGRSAATPDKGLELNLKAVYKHRNGVELGLGGGYLFADRGWQPKDSAKLQAWFVYNF